MVSVSEFQAKYNAWCKAWDEVLFKMGVDTRHKSRVENSLVVAKTYYDLYAKSEPLNTEESNIFNALNQVRRDGRELFGKYHEVEDKEYLKNRGTCEMCNVMIFIAPLDAINGIKHLDEEDAQFMRKLFSEPFDFGAVFMGLGMVKDMDPQRMFKDYNDGNKDPYPEKDMNQIVAQVERMIDDYPERTNMSFRKMF